MPFYIGGGIGPIRYSHRLGGRRRPPRPPRPVRDYTPAQARRQFIAGAVILAICAAVAVALCLAAML